MSKEGMTAEELEAMRLLIWTAVEKVDGMGMGRELMDHLGPEMTEALMKEYRAHEGR